MAKETAALRFDHREIAVIFSLFIFVSLLMFTVGILVGKGLTQARLEGGRRGPAISQNDSHSVPLEAPVIHPTKAEHGSNGHGATRESASAAVHPKSSALELKEPAVVDKDVAPLEMIPQKKVSKAYTGGSLREPKMSKEVSRAISSTRVQSLIENTPDSRKAAMLATGKIPESFADGKFTVQVGSYPTEEAATERVEKLKQLGFPHAYMSATDLGEPSKKWYRVGLGYFKDNVSAEVSGQMLRSRGEVNSYIVRTKDTSG